MLEHVLVSKLRIFFFFLLQDQLILNVVFFELQYTLFCIAIVMPIGFEITNHPRVLSNLQMYCIYLHAFT